PERPARAQRVPAAGVDCIQLVSHLTVGPHGHSRLECAYHVARIAEPCDAGEVMLQAEFALRGGGEYAAKLRGLCRQRLPAADAGVVADCGPGTDRDGMFDDAARADRHAWRKMGIATHQRVVADDYPRDDQHTGPGLIRADQVRILADEAAHADAHVMGLAHD